MKKSHNDIIRKEVGNLIEPILSTSITALIMGIKCDEPMTKEQYFCSVFAHWAGNMLGQLPSNTVPLSYNKSISKCPMKTEELVAMSLAQGYNNSIIRKGV